MNSQYYRDFHGLLHIYREFTVLQRFSKQVTLALKQVSKYTQYLHLYWYKSESHIFILNLRNIW